MSQSPEGAKKLSFIVHSQNHKRQFVDEADSGLSRTRGRLEQEDTTLVSPWCFIPNVLRPSDLVTITADPILVDQVPQLLTPSNLLEQVEFGDPLVISPEQYPDFNTLVRNRDLVRNLKLLPIKTDYEYERYKSEPRDLLVERVKSYLGSEELALAPNLFPYFLPADLRQFLIWVKDREVEETAVCEFIAKSMTVYRLGVEDIILFERSLKTRERIVRGTFPEFRHIHFWSRLRIVEP